MTAPIRNVSSCFAPVGTHLFGGGWWRAHGFDADGPQRVAIGWLVIHWLGCGAGIVGWVFMPIGAIFEVAVCWVNLGVVGLFVAVAHSSLLAGRRQPVTSVDRAY